MFEFAAPFWLAMLPLPVLAWWLLYRRPRQAAREDESDALIHPLTRIIAQLQEERTRTAPTPWMWLLGCLLLIIAMARPQWLDFRSAGDEPGHNIVFAVDVSGSMRALDYVVDGKRISRLDMLKQALKHFLERTGHIRASLVVFADDAMSFMPLTSDLALAAQMVDEIDNSLAGERTALGDALALSIKRMQAVPGSDAARILVLLTDGVSTAGSVTPDAAAELARDLGIRIYTVGLGSEGKVAFPLTSHEDVTYAEMPLDEDLLQRLATRTDGAYFRVAETASMDRILDRIDQIEKARIAVPAQAQEWYWLPTIAALLLLVFAERRVRYGMAAA